jgi:aspartate/methionine/tyrosine aminotransferase
MQLAGRYGIYVFCDEVYRELEHDSATRLPAGCELYERAVSLGSMSKTYGLAGLRLGWLVSRDPKILQLCTQLKYYTTICSSAPSEYLTDLAIRHREKIIGHNLQFVLHNLKLLSTFLARRSDLFSWTPPNAGPIGFVRYQPAQPAKSNLPTDVQTFCETLVQQSGVLLLPGSVYDQPHHIRFGFGRRNMPESLSQLDSYLSLAH